MFSCTSVAIYQLGCPSLCSWHSSCRHTTYSCMQQVLYDNLQLSDAHFAADVRTSVCCKLWNESTPPGKMRVMGLARAIASSLAEARRSQSCKVCIGVDGRQNAEALPMHT